MSSGEILCVVLLLGILACWIIVPSLVMQKQQKKSYVRLSMDEISKMSSDVLSIRINRLEKRLSKGNFPKEEKTDREIELRCMEERLHKLEEHEADLYWRN